MPTILLTGDVMLGRGIDQILRHRNSPELYEPFVRSALDYVTLAERKYGPMPRDVACDHIWGDALHELWAADLRIINLETAMTCCDEPAPKGINYRCHPSNLECLTAAGIDCCVLANNHILDWGEKGLLETLDALEEAGISHAGAGHDIIEAEAPAIMHLPGAARVLVYALGAPSSGVPHSWAAAPGRPGLSFLDDDELAVERLGRRIAANRRPADIVIASIHWGPNWGYDVPLEHQRFAHQLIHHAGVDLVHGHSSHHPMAVEIFRGRPIFYGCGDFLNDYEGITGHEAYRSELVLGYRTTLEPGGECSSLGLLPFRIAGFRLNRASPDETEWLASIMDRQCRRFGGEVVPEGAALRLKSAEMSATHE